jgi:hypothetical protein
VTTRLVQGFDEFTVALFGTDNDTMQLAVAPLAADRRFRTLTNPDVFTAVVRTIATYRDWLAVLDPISTIFQMVAPRNHLRRLVVEGSPVVTGLHAVGDAVCTTNPTFGRGLSLAAWMAADLVTALDEHPRDCAERSLMLDGLVADHVAPFYEEQAVVDSARLAALRAAVADRPVPVPAHAGSDRITFAELRDAALFDPVAFRAFFRVMGMLCLPDQIYTDPLVVSRTRDALRRHARRRAPEGPTRRELLLALRE